MATSVGEIEVKLTLKADDFQRILGQSKQGLNDFQGATHSFMSELTKVFSFVAIADFFKKSIDAYGEQELAIAKLTRALESHGIASNATLGHIQDMAHQLEKLTGVEDNQIISAQALLTTFGLQGAEMDRATKASLDLSAGLGIDLNQAAMLVAKAFEGNTTMLSRYGIRISEAIDPTKKFGVVLNELEAKFGGQAAAQAETFSGTIKQLGNSFQHLEEEMGKLLAGEGGGIVGWMKSIVDSMTKALGFINDIRSTTSSFTTLIEGTLMVLIQAVFTHMLNIVAMLVNIGSHIPIIGGQIAALKPQIDFTRLAINAVGDAERKAFLENAKDTEGIIGNEKKKQTEFHNTAKAHMDVDKAMNEWIANQRLLDRNDYMADLKTRDVAYQEFYSSLVTTQEDVWKEATQLVSTFTQGVGDGFAKMIVEGKSFSDSMKALFQNLAEQIISYIVQMIVKMLILLALESATGIGPSGGGAVSIFSGAMADGGVIAEPSVITGLRSGRHILAGEAGPEMVVPMGGTNMTASEMGGSPSGGGGGGSITINISGQFVEGDANSWQRMMRERIIPEIRRFTMSSPTGPFNRKRGVV